MYACGIAFAPIALFYNGLDNSFFIGSVMCRPEFTPGNEFLRFLSTAENFLAAAVPAT